ncbi:hypothetical protein BDV93DRAFT_611346 [Ceratobasidium sp. AG-I]|nr:hypothetical protein BDV93DRAFT_611346 [Ceratobasidium sp. AG-I]
MSEFSVETEQSDEKSHRSAARFSSWAQSVRLDEVVRHINLPEPLTRLLTQSRLVPGWIFNQARHVSSSQLAHPETIRFLVAAQHGNVLAQDEDSDLSRDVEIALPLVLNIVTHHQLLDTAGRPSPNEADRRNAMDTFGYYAWDRLTSYDLKYCPERLLQLPKTSRMELYETKPDSTVFFRIKPTPSFSTETDVACSSLARSSQDRSLMLHWATELKRERSERVAKQQLFRALVTGVYQRRSLGFPDHFVFGTAHYSTTDLDVFAATWEVPKEEQQPTARASQQKTPSSNIPVAQQEATQGASAGVLNTRSEGKGKGLQAKVADDSKNKGQIVLYRLGTFGMDRPVEMLRLYLLMRSTRSLANQYCQEIDQCSLDRIEVQLQDLTWIYDWPAPPRESPSGSEKTDFDPKKRKLSTHHEKKEPQTALEPAGVNAHETVAMVGIIDAPLKLHYVKELNDCFPGDKVLRYLADSPWDQFEPVPDPVIDFDD